MTQPGSSPPKRVRVRPRPRVARIGTAPPRGQVAAILEWVLVCIGAAWSRSDIVRVFPGVAAEKGWRVIAPRTIDEYVRSARDRIAAEYDPKMASTARANIADRMRKREQSMLRLADKIEKAPKPDLSAAAGVHEAITRVQEREARVLGLLRDGTGTALNVNEGGKAVIITGDAILEGIRASGARIPDPSFPASDAGDDGGDAD